MNIRAGAIAAAMEELRAMTQEISRNVVKAADAARELAARVAGVAQSINDLRFMLVRVVCISMAEVD